MSPNVQTKDLHTVISETKKPRLVELLMRSMEDDVVDLEDRERERADDDEGSSGG